MHWCIVRFYIGGVWCHTEHTLREVVSEEYYRFLMTAIRYNQVHALVICGFGLGFFASAKLRNFFLLRASAWLFIIGTVLFCFSIYTAVLLDSKAITYITPVGGTTLMMAWLILAWAGRRAALLQQDDSRY